jgi:DNA-binding NtrC family response regulator
MTEKILLIDDETDFLEIMSERMSARNMQVTTASSARDGLKIAIDGNFDAVVLDLRMPEMDGLETLRILKEKNPDLEVILLTGHATVRDSVEAIKLGALDLLEKPADLDTLTEKIKDAQTKKMVLVEKKNEQAIRDIIASKGW